MITGSFDETAPIFDSWHITRQIGRGALGRVYEIERVEFGTTYKAALKVISIPESEEDIKHVLFNGVAKEDLRSYYSNLMKNVVSELQYLGRLKGHSNIMSYEDHEIIEREEGIGWDVLIKTELLQPLVEYSIDNRLDETAIVRLGIDICKALEFCGSMGIVHRDIKPENIFISPGGDYKLGDFGIARIVEETQSGLSRKGTYTYMAPEVFRGEAYGASADIYSLGLIMYQYLNHGRIPFMPPYPRKILYDDVEKAMAMRVSGKNMVPPAQGSGRLRNIVLKACTYERSSRYLTATEMREDLEELYLKQYIKKNRKNKKAKKGKNPGRGYALQTTVHGIDDTVSQVVAKENVQKSEQRSDTDKTSESSKTETRRGSRKAIIAASVIAVIAATAAAVYAMIPKEVEDISGVNNHIKLYYDGSKQLEYQVEPDWFKDEPVIFESSDKKVFTVSDEGLITATGQGEATLQMHARGYTEDASVAVVPKVTEIGNIDKAYELETGDTKQLKPSLKPEKFSSEPLTYKSSDKSVAKISKKGKITAVSEGSATIRISAGGTSIRTKITVKEPVVETYTYTPTVNTYRTYSNSSRSSGKSSRSGSSGGSGKKKSGGYFKSSDDQYF